MPDSETRLDDLHDKIQHCYDCKIRFDISINKPMKMNRGTSAARIMAIGQAPGQAALTRQQAFAGNSFTRLYSWFVEAGFTGDTEYLRSKMYLTSLLKCAPESTSRKTVQRCYGICRKFLWDQLELINPELVLLLGKDACEIIAPFGEAFGETVGRVFTSSEIFQQELFPPTLDPKSRWIFLPHPSGLSRTMNEPNVKTKVIEALRRELGQIKSLNS